MSIITAIKARLFKVPLAEVLVDAKHGDHTHFELVTCTVTLADGRVATGYTYTGGWGGHAILAMIEHDLTPCLLGRDAFEVERIHDDLRWHIHYVGRGGISAFAIAAVDTALWDLRGRALGQSLAQMAGGASDRCRAYFGGIDLGFSLPKLLDSVDGYLAQGANGVKIKIGHPDPGEDLERIAAVRAHIGPDVKFMVDANYALDVETALRAIRGFEPYDLMWFEEPIDPDDLEGYRRIARETGFPLAAGENSHSIHDFNLQADSGAFSFLQPDVATCGGITTWLRAAELCEARGISVCTHGMQELHVSLLSGRKGAGWLEVHSFPIDQYTTRPLVIEKHMAVAPDTPGIGVTFDWEKLESADAQMRSTMRASQGGN